GMPPFGRCSPWFPASPAWHGASPRESWRMGCRRAAISRAAGCGCTACGGRWPDRRCCSARWRRLRPMYRPSRQPRPRSRGRPPPGGGCGARARAEERAMLSARLRHHTPEAPAHTAEVAGADTTFRRLLGEAAWQRLNPNVRARFAVKPAAGEVFAFGGAMSVVRRSWFGWLLAQICRLIGTPVAPQRGRDVPTVVRVYRSGGGDGIVWERRYAFAGRRRPVVVSSSKRVQPPARLLACCAHG